MHRFKIDDPDICLEFMQRNFCITKKERPFCAIGPDHAIEHVNKFGEDTATNSYGKMVP